MYRILASIQTCLYLSHPGLKMFSFFLWYWELNSRAHTWEAGSLRLEPCPQPIFFAIVNFWLQFSQSMILLLMPPMWLEWQAYTTWLVYELGWDLANFCLAWHQTTILPISTSQKAYSFLSPNVIIIVNYKSSPKHLKITFLFTSSFPSHLSPLIFLSTCFSLVVLASGRISPC
jgi:hypothetical protein